MTWLGLDIGGANLKAADGCGWARTVPFALYQSPGELQHRLSNLIEGAPTADRIAVTMSGELCDCFRTKAEGVRHILTAAAAAAPDSAIRVYQVDGRFVGLDEALLHPELAAASNWHALARFACRYVGRGAGLVVDIGSTTTDIIPLLDGVVHTTSRSDTERLLARELVYMGVGRTPICAVVESLPWRGANCPVAAELFATTADAYVLLGDIAEDARSKSTADGRPLTKVFARERLARMICADVTTLDESDSLRSAVYIREQQIHQLDRAIRCVADKIGIAPPTVVLCGSGEFLAELLSGIGSLKKVSLAKELGSDVSSAAPAHAVAVLSAE